MSERADGFWWVRNLQERRPDHWPWDMALVEGCEFTRMGDGLSLFVSNESFVWGPYLGNDPLGPVQDFPHGLELLEGAIGPPNGREPVYKHHVVVGSTAEYLGTEPPKDDLDARGPHWMSVFGPDREEEEVP